MKHARAIGYSGIALVLILTTLGGWMFFAQSGVQAEVGNPVASPAVDPDHQKLLDRAQSDASSDLEIQALEDGVISPEEYEAAITAYTACMVEAGYEVITTPSQSMPGMVIITHEPIEDSGDQAADANALRTASRECEIGTTRIIQKVYASQIANLDGDDHPVATFECVVESRREDGEYTVVINDLEVELLSTPMALTGKLVVIDGTNCLVQPQAEATPAP